MHFTIWILLDVFTNLQIALINFKDDYYDLLLLDVRMPEMNGFEFTQEINKID
jgi:DNA-binding response OmpR family regulator